MLEMAASRRWDRGRPSLRLCQAQRATRGSPLLLCQPPVGPVLALLSPLAGGSIHADPIQSTVPEPHLSSMMMSGPPGPGGNGGYAASSADSRRLEGGACQAPAHHRLQPEPLLTCATLRSSLSSSSPLQGQRPEEAGF